MRHQTPETYGTELVTIRRGLELTQAEFAACLGIRSDSLSRYERGKRHVPEPTIRLARQLVTQNTRSTVDTSTPDPHPRTPWDMALMACTHRASAAYPAETTRILKAMAIVLEGGVTMAGGECRVQSQRHADVQYKVGSICTCYDAAHAPEGRCKHRWAKALYTKAMQEHTA